MHKNHKVGAKDEASNSSIDSKPTDQEIMHWIDDVSICDTEVELIQNTLPRTRQASESQMEVELGLGP